MQNSQYIRVGSLIDGSGGPVRKDQLIKIEAGHITEIIGDTFTDSAPQEQITDLSHCVVLPVLIDSHVHLCMSGSIDPEYREKQLDAAYEELVPIMAEHLRHQFSHGVLGLRDGGDRYAGKGVQTAVANVVDTIAPALLGEDAADQAGPTGIARHLGDIAIRTGRTIKWDEEKETIIDDPEAAKMLKRAMRAPWAL